MTLRELVDELTAVAEKEQAWDAPLWIECAKWVSGHEVSVSRPVYHEGGARTEVRLSVQCSYDGSSE